MADRKSQSTTIGLERLVLDEQNPRLAKPLPQDEVLGQFAKSPKTLKLAEHLAQHGISPLDTIAVVPGVKPGRYVVKEGNRRVAALRLLSNPHLAGEDRLTSRYRKLAKDAAVPVAKDVTCIVFNGPDEVNEWILVKHSGEMGGAGTVAWDAMQRGRFNLRNKRPDQYATAYRFLDTAVAQEWISEDEANDVNVSSLTRVLKDRDVQQALMAETADDNGVTFRLAGDGPRRLAKRLVQDWRREGGLTVQKIYTKTARREYADRLKADLNLEESDDTQPRADPTTGDSSGKTTRPSRTRRGSIDRRTLVPRSFTIPVPDDLRRTAFVLQEMKALDVKRFPNAAACLFRAFIETSVNCYIRKHSVPVNAREDRLGARTEKVIAHLRKNVPDAQSAIRPVKAALSKDSSIFSISTLHEYVHNPRWHPEPDDLLKHWDTYSPFLALLWA